MLQLAVGLDVGSAARGKLGADAVILCVVGLVAVGRRQDIILVVGGISIVALHLALEFLGAEVDLQDKVVLQLAESVDVLLFLDVLFSKAHALHLLEAIGAQSIDLIEAGVAALVELGHDGVVLGTLAVEVGIVLQAFGGAGGQLLEQQLLDLCQAAIAHLEVELAT